MSLGAKRDMRKRVRPFTTGLSLAMMLGMVAFALYKSEDNAGGLGRKLSAFEGCDDVKIDAWEDGSKGALWHVFLMFYVFCALAVICDDYFCESLEKISEGLGLSPDVAGATFMAAGSSAPELFVSMADNVFAEETKSLGVGTIIGSAIFNILIIIALTAALAGQDLQLDFRPLARDSTWYTISIILMIIAIADGTVNTGESAMLVISYIGYVVYMYFNETIQSKFCKSKDSSYEPGELSIGITDFELGGVEESALIKAAKATKATTDKEAVSKDGATEETSNEDAAAEAPIPPGNQPDTPSSIRKPSADFNDPESTLNEDKEGSGDNGDDEDDDENPGPYFEGLKWSSVEDEGIMDKIWWVFTYPINVAFRFTVPDCQQEVFSGPSGYTTCFIMSIVWIALLSHFLVEFATKFGCIVGMPFTLMGLTIVAAGTSVPDAISSVVVAKAGQGDMAVSNAIGSNVFDILLGLGLPYFISNVVRDVSPSVEVDDLLPSICILYGILAAVILILWWSGWMLNPKVGMSLLGIYIIYVIFAYAHMLNK